MPLLRQDTENVSHAEAEADLNLDLGLGVKEMAPERLVREQLVEFCHLILIPGVTEEESQTTTRHCWKQAEEFDEMEQVSNVRILEVDPEGDLRGVPLNQFTCQAAIHHQHGYAGVGEQERVGSVEGDLGLFGYLATHPEDCRGRALLVRVLVLQLKLSRRSSGATGSSTRVDRP